MSYINLPSILLAVPRNPVTALGIPFVFGMLSGSPTPDAVRGSWYNTLTFPPGRPPNKAFPIVWSTLYLAMGYASHLAVQAHDSTSSFDELVSLHTGLALYYAQLGLNFSWTTLFFVKKKVGLALVDSVLITAASLYMTKLFHGPTGGRTTYLLAPYCSWLLYATYLNAGTWWLNRGRQVKRAD